MGIVTVPDPATGGAGAPVIVSEIVNAQWDAAQVKSEAGSKYVSIAALNAAPGAVPQMLPVTVDKSYLPPEAPEFPNMDPNNGEAIYNEKVEQLTTLIKTSFDDFISQFFPNPTTFTRAMQWCDDAYTVGGTGINISVESALWQRGRARILSDSLRAEREAEDVWANRRFPTPPGALINQTNEIRLDAGRKLAEQSRDISVKSFDTEIENIRFAVKLVIDQRAVALNAAGDYIKTLMLGPQTAMQLATGLQGLQNAYINALVGYYSAQVEASKPQVQLAITDATLQADVGKANLSAKEMGFDALSKIYLAGAQMMAAQASAGINGINAGAAIQGNDNTSS